ncbi:hypothetical protein SAMN05877753_11415 [Bacillus oleivorans]|uniref:Uncharacterized protein n=1 Tax=Bacillus oleivorans TaxID=1448271 RepID=A0A285D7J9_9BACI|nr:hypothetical protein [Bacillus oleivorans]SNX75605.1 hypothetical protein SAMN05877753_11415 [Bacillus oleivorans]
MIEYYIDGSTKDKMVGAGVVKVNEFGFIEKHHFKAEHINPTSNLAEGYALEKTFEMIKKDDIGKNEIIDIYTDCKSLYTSLLHNENKKFNNSNFFIKEETNYYFQHIRNLFIELNSRHSDYPVYHCIKTCTARPLIKIYFKDQLEDKKYLQAAHLLSREYIKEETKVNQVELKAVKENNKWVIVKEDDQQVLAENKRPLIALSDALTQKDTHGKRIILCSTLAAILKCTNKEKLSNESIKSAIKIIENHKLVVSS